MKLQAYFESDGISVDTPDGRVSIDLTPTQDWQDIHIKDIDDSGDHGMCDVVGDTYQAKEDIKKLPYGDDGTKWTGGVWAVNPREKTTLVGVLLKAGYSVSIDANCLKYDEDWGKLRREILLDDEGDEKLSVVHPPYGPDNKVPRSWAEDAGQLANFDSIEEFAERFSLNIVPDEEAMKDLGLDEDDEEVLKIGTDV